MTLEEVKQDIREFLERTEKKSHNMTVVASDRVRSKSNYKLMVKLLRDLEAIQPATCSTCEFWDKKDQHNFRHACVDSDDDSITMYTSADFGCTEHKRKAVE